MIDATHLKARRRGGQLAQKGRLALGAAPGRPVACAPRRIGRIKGDLNSKLHAVCDGNGRPLILLLSEGQMSDFKGAALMIDAFPKAKTLLADKGYDASCSPSAPMAQIWGCELERFSINLVHTRTN